MYCGSCFRDNALAIELLAQGHDISLVPVYTPTRTEDTNVSQHHVLFGGISVYLQHKFAAFRHGPRLLDRLWDRPQVIQAFAGRSVSNDPKLLGSLTVSMLRGQSGVLKREFEKLMDWTRDQPVPDIVNLPNSLLVSMAGPLRAAFKRPVCCTLQGEELFLESLVTPYRDDALALIRKQVADVDHFVAVSDYGARFMSGYLQIPARQMSVVPLGINLTGYRPRQTSSNTFVVGYFARVAPEKGLHVLADAFIRLSHRVADASLRLEAAGYLSAGHHAYLDDVRRRLAHEGLADRFVYHGELLRENKIDFLSRLDVMSVPATYDEPKGFSLLEAMASGVPVVQPRRGAFTEIVERTGGGVLVEPDDPDALAGGLHSLWRDRAHRDALGRRGAAGVAAHYSIGQSARRLVEVYESALRN
jgi:glycosyltransferase involved in cell wall biosynthesis